MKQISVSRAIKLQGEITRELKRMRQIMFKRTDLNLIDEYKKLASDLVGVKVGIRQSNLINSIEAEIYKLHELEQLIQIYKKIDDKTAIFAALERYNKLRRAIDESNEQTNIYIPTNSNFLNNSILL